MTERAQHIKSLTYILREVKLTGGARRPIRAGEQATRAASFARTLPPPRSLTERSGFGRDAGQEGLTEYMDQKFVSIGLDGQ